MDIHVISKILLIHLSLILCWPCQTKKDYEMYSSEDIVRKISNIKNMMINIIVFTHLHSMSLPQVNMAFNEENFNGDFHQLLRQQ